MINELGQLGHKIVEPNELAHSAILIASRQFGERMRAAVFL